MLNKKYKFFFIFFISLVISSLIIYKITFYIPPLLDSGRRNIIEKTIDFFCFGYHFTKASIYSDYLKKTDKAIRELGKAAWYRKKYFVKKFGVNGDDLTSILELYKKLKINSISEELHAFFVREQNK